MSGSDPADDVADDASYGSLSAAFWALVIFGGLAIGGWDFAHIYWNALSSVGYPIDVIDNLKVTLLALEAIGGGGTVAVIGYVVWRYAAPHRAAARALRPGEGKYTVTMWTIGVLLLMTMSIFMGASALAQTDEAAHPIQQVDTNRQLHVEVVGSQWVWRMDADGVPYTQSERLVVPSKTLVNLDVTSADVIHSFAIQELGIKKDAIPGQVNHASFMVDGVSGETTVAAGGQQLPADVYQINCAELCGKGHSKMVAKLYVVSPEDYATWVHAQNGTVPDSATAEGGS